VRLEVNVMMISSQKSSQHRSTLRMGYWLYRGSSEWAVQDSKEPTIQEKNGYSEKKRRKIRRNLERFRC